MKGDDVDQNKSIMDLLPEWKLQFGCLENIFERKEGLLLIENIENIWLSTETLEKEASARGQDWENIGRKLWMEATGTSEIQAAIKFAMDLSPWSPAPWTSPLPESIESMSNVVRQFNINGLLQAWKLKVMPSCF